MFSNHSYSQNPLKVDEGTGLGFLAFVKYSLESVVRNGKRSLYALIGILIAISLISGSWIAVDSSGVGLLRAAVDGVPVDYLGTDISNPALESDDVLNVTASTVGVIDSVRGIQDAVPFITVKSAYYKNDSGGIYLDEHGLNFSGNLLFLSNQSHQVLDSFKIAGELPSPGTVAIPRDVADSLGLSVGDNITGAFQRDEFRLFRNGSFAVVSTYLNISYPISSIWTQTGFEKQDQAGFGVPFANKGERDIWLGQVNNSIVFDLSDYARLSIDRARPDYLYSVSWNYFIWVNRGEVIRLGNLPATIDALSTIQSQLAKKLYPIDVIVSTSNLVSPLESLDSDLGGVEPLFLALSVPIIALGVYLSMVGVDLGVNERRREAGVLKSRGASNRQVFSSLIIEAVALGAISGVAGLLLGAVVSRFLLGAVASMGGEAITEITDFLASSTTVVLSILLGIGLMFFSSYGPFKRVSRTEVAQALHHHSPTATQLEYSPNTDFLLIGLSVWSVVSIFLGTDWVGEQRFPWIAEVAVYTIVLFGITILPLLPIMLSLSLVRLLTRGSRRLYSRFAWFVKPWTKDLHYLVDRNIVRNPRRASNLCMIISLALAFGLFISVTMESTLNYEREQVRFEVGSDIRIESTSGHSDQSTLNLTALDGVGSLAGVRHAVTYSQLDLLFDISGLWHRASSVVMNATGYLETADPSNYYFGEGGRDAFAGLADGRGVVLTEDFASQLDIQVGDVLPSVIESYANYNRLSVKVVGFVKGLPGLAGAEAFIDRQALSGISSENLTGVYHSNGAFIAAEPGSDFAMIAYSAAKIFERENLTATSQVLRDRLDALNKDPTFASLADFLYMEYALSIVIMTVGVGLLIFVAVHDREKELACIMARGSSGKQVRRILMGESMSLTILGLIVGTCIGILTAYLFNTLSGEQLYAAVERKMVFTYVSVAIVLASIVALLAASLVATARAGKIKLAEVLRIRGG